MLAVLRYINFTVSSKRNYFAVYFAVFVNVIAMTVQMPQCNFSDEIIK